MKEKTIQNTGSKESSEKIPMFIYALNKSWYKKKSEATILCKKNCDKWR